MAIEIVSFPINSMVIFHSYVKLPEGNNILYCIVLCLSNFFPLSHALLRYSEQAFSTTVPQGMIIPEKLDKGKKKSTGKPHTRPGKR